MGTHPIFESDFDCLTECSTGGVGFKLWILLKRENSRIYQFNIRSMAQDGIVFRTLSMQEESFILLRSLSVELSVLLFILIHNFLKIRIPKSSRIFFAVDL